MDEPKPKVVVIMPVNFQTNSDQFIFDQEVIAQIVDADFRIAEVSVPTRCFPEASSAGLVASSRYGLGIPWLALRYAVHRTRRLRQKNFQSLRRRYTKVERAAV